MGNSPYRALIPRQKISEIVGHYQKAEHYLNEAQRHLELACEHGPSLPYREDQPKDILRKHRQRLWHQIIGLTPIERFLTERRYREVRKQIADGEMPDITEANIWGWLTELRETYQTYVDEACAELVRWLIPGPWQDHKTPSRGGVGRKCIVQYAWRSGLLGHGCVKHERVQIINRLWDVLHFLDGQALPETRLVSMMDAAAKDGEDQLDTEYLSARWYKNSNIHFTFHRDDLLQELNRRGGGSGIASERNSS